MKKIAISGSAPVTLADVSSTGSFDWNANDTIVYGTAGGIIRVSANGGTPDKIIKTAKGESYFIHPQILPDGKSVLFTRIYPSPAKIMVQSFKSGEPKELIQGNAGKYLLTGQIVYEEGGNLFAVPFDLKALRVAGGPVPVVEGVLRTSGAPQYAVSDSGTLVYVPGAASSGTVGRTLVWVDRKGKEVPIAVARNNYSSPSISPDKRAGFRLHRGLK